MQTLKQRAILARVARRRGQSAEKREAVRAAQAQQRDWRGRCRKCGAELTGTLAELKEHRCG